LLLSVMHSLVRHSC